MTRELVMAITRIEALHLSQMTEQFRDLLDATTDPSSDDAVARLVPEGYLDDDAAAREFRRLTERELLDRRHTDAETVLGILRPTLPAMPIASDDPALTEEVVVHASAADVSALLRTLSAIRLVLATRLGIQADDDHDASDPRFGIYDWLGYRLDSLISAIDADSDPRGT